VLCLEPIREGRLAAVTSISTSITRSGPAAPAALVSTPTTKVATRASSSITGLSTGAPVVDPTVDYHERAYLVREGEVLDVWEIDLRCW
jgi:hypothetical protein